MLLAVDIGNSTISTGLFGLDGELRFLASLDTDYRKTADQICVDLMNLFQLYHFRYEDVTDSILCSVVPPLNMELMATPASTITEGVTPRTRDSPRITSVVATPPRKAQSVTSVGLLMVSAAAEPEPVLSCEPAPSQMMETAAQKDAP